MKAPVLSRKLVLEAPLREADGAGGWSDGWRVLGTVWAQVVHKAGREAALAGAQVSRVRTEIVVRGAPHGAPDRPRPEQRFREGPRVFRILAVAERDRFGLWLTCDCLEEEAA